MKFCGLGHSGAYQCNVPFGQQSPQAADIASYTLNDELDCSDGATWMWHHSAFVLVMFGLVFMLAKPVPAQQASPKKRIALVIGNDSYRQRGQSERLNYGGSVLEQLDKEGRGGHNT